MAYYLAAIENACPGLKMSEYQDALERVLRLTELANKLAGMWYEHKVADLEGRERLEKECPGFSSLIYNQAWGSAILLNR